MKSFLKILALLLILAVFIGTIFYLYNKSRKKAVVFKTTTPFETDIIKKGGRISVDGGVYDCRNHCHLSVRRFAAFFGGKNLPL